MELVEGDDLSQRIARGAIPLDEALPIAKQIADALEAAHEQGIIHRDLKPANIKLRPDGVVKVLDFGLAKAVGPPEGGRYVRGDRSVRLQADLSNAPTVISPLTGAGSILGTFHYMAPEQARGDDVDVRTDLFSVGVTLHEMVTGVLPFPSSTSAVIFDAILNRPPAALDRMHPDLARIVSRALEKSPDLRYQSAADLGSDLARLTRDSESGNAGVARKAVRQTGARKGIDSLAVLPLATTGGDADAEYLSEGIAESLINSFSQLGRLRVAPPQKSFRYRGADVDLQRAARELNVQAIVTGRVVLRGDTLVVKMSLVVLCQQKVFRHSCRPFGVVIV